MDKTIKLQGCITKGETREHITDGTPCWCNPKVIKIEPKTLRGLAGDFREKEIVFSKDSTDTDDNLLERLDTFLSSIAGIIKRDVIGENSICSVNPKNLKTKFTENCPICLENYIKDKQRSKIKEMCK